MLKLEITAVNMDGSDHAFKAARPLAFAVAVKGHAHGTILVTNHQVDVGNFVAVAGQGFTDVHGHGRTSLGVA